MDLFAPVLGKSTTEFLQSRAALPIVKIGRDVFTRVDLSGVRCFNFTAAQHLSTVIATFDVKDTRDFFDRIAPQQLAVPGVGVIAFAVVSACFEKKNIGGDHPLAAWVTKHHPADQKSDYVTFDTLKIHSKRDQQAERKERRAAKARKASRRDQAHRLRRDRFERRTSVN